MTHHSGVRQKTIQLFLIDGHRRPAGLDDLGIEQDAGWMRTTLTQMKKAHAKPKWLRK